MREGSLEAPIRHPIDWTDPEFVNLQKLDEEMRRVFDICHGCRRCFNLCDSFPRLFELIDGSATGELDSVKSNDFGGVVEACTLCDMCFLTKCPYVPPHEFNVDFPHLMLRYRVAEFKAGQLSSIHQEITKTDRNGKIASALAPLVNWSTSTQNKITRPLLEKVAGIDQEAAIPAYASQTLMEWSQKNKIKVNPRGPAQGEKVVLFGTCLGNYNMPAVGKAAAEVLAHQGVEVVFFYEGCCQMPALEQGNMEKVAKAAVATGNALQKYLVEGYDVVSLIPSCSLMMKGEWPLVAGDHKPVLELSTNAYDISQYVVRLNKVYGLAPGLRPLGEALTVHIACHARAQNMGRQAVEMLRLIPELEMEIIERCSGHGGSWGMMKGNFEVALKIGRPVAKQALKAKNRLVLSECPLAGAHIVQGMERLTEKPEASFKTAHPIELLAQAYGFEKENK